MAIAPDTGNYCLGKGIVYFNMKDATSGIYGGERDLGNAPEFSFTVDLEKLPHFSSRGGLKSKDLEVISQITPAVSFTLDEMNKDNFALLTLGDVTEVVQSAGAGDAEVVTCNLNKRADLAKRSMVYWQLPYDGGTGLFVVGETVTGAGGATGLVLVVTGNVTSGTLTIGLTNTTAYVDDEVLTGSAAGAADVDSATGGTLGTGTPIVLVQDDADTVTYVSGTDYIIEPTLKDDVIGRIKFLGGGTVTEAQTVHVSYGYAAVTYHTIETFANTVVEGVLRFVSDNPVGMQQELEVWRCSLAPDGDTAMIGDDWSTMAFTGEILKDASGHPDSPYMTITVV